MSVSSKLKFFGGNGSSLNLVQDDDGVWRGTVHFERVSTGLIENQHLFIVEEVMTGSPGLDVVYPVAEGESQADALKLRWKASWKTQENSDQFWLYTVTQVAGVPYITRNEVVTADVQAVPYTIDSEGFKVVDPGDVESRAMQFNIAFTSESELVYERTLVIEDLSPDTSPYAATTVAEVTFYGETVGEDERLRLFLENLGRKFTEQDAFITRDYDVKEGRIDFQMVNEKRKELLIAGDEIYPYVGSYRGLVNALRFFGYQDLRVKEYWLNVDENSENYGKYLQWRVDGILEDANTPYVFNPLVASVAYRKTSFFGLFYDITRESGDVDQYGIPITENASMFSNEEVLLKLMALKKKLRDEFLPSNARIIDITGEGIYFERYGVVNWNDRLETITARIGTEIDFTAEPTFGYVKDLRRFKVKRFSPGLDLPVDNFTQEVNPYEFGQAYPPYAIDSLVESIENYYEEIRTVPWPYLDEKEEFKGDEPGIVAGCPVVLKADVSSFTWDEMVVAWDSQDLSGMTWDSIDYAAFYEIEWRIEKSSGLPYRFVFRGRLDQYNTLPHFLPYHGKYTVTMLLYDGFNARSAQTKVGHIEVVGRELEIGAFGRWRDRGQYNWSMDDLSWDDLSGSTWYEPSEGVSKYNNPFNEQYVTWPRFRDQYSALVMSPYSDAYQPINYVASESIEKDNPARRFGTYMLRWENMDLPWDEMFHSTWNMYDYHADHLGGFKIYAPDIGDKIKIGDHPWFEFYDVSPGDSVLDLDEAAYQLNLSTNQGLRHFDFHVTESDTGPFIHATAKMPGAYGWYFISYSQINSPGGITGDPVSWTFPNWVDHEPILNAILAQFPEIDPDMMFLDTTLADLRSGASSVQSYWEDKGFLKTEEPSTEYPLGERRGFLPSWYGAGAFSNPDMRAFKNDFYAPMGVPLFFITNHSEVPGRDQLRWIVTNDVTGEVVIDVKHRFLIMNFIEESRYSIECYAVDSNGNSAYGKRTGFVQILSKADYDDRVLDDKRRAEDLEAAVSW